MKSLLQNVETLTRCRDGQRLDELMAQSLFDRLRPRWLGVARACGEEGDQRWLPTVRLGPCPDDLYGPPDRDLSSLTLVQCPRLRDVRCRLSCVETRQGLVQSQAHETWITLPMFDEGAQVALIEFALEAPLSSALMLELECFVKVIAHHHALLEYAQHDTLTGLLNRKTFDESFLKATMAPRNGDAEGVQQRREHEGMGHWLAIIDIDHFKSINDRFGHLIGDEVLLLLARLMRRNFRFHDRLYRFGGEEFLVLLRCDGDADAQAACRRFLDAVRAYDFPRVGRVTVSIGYTEVEHGAAPTLAFSRADRAVYYAKRHGRNQVCSHDALEQAGELSADAQVGEMELF